MGRLIGDVVCSTCMEMGVTHGDVVTVVAQGDILAQRDVVAHGDEVAH